MRLDTRTIPAPTKNANESAFTGEPAALQPLFSGSGFAASPEVLPELAPDDAPDEEEVEPAAPDVEVAAPDVEPAAPEVEPELVPGAVNVPPSGFVGAGHVMSGPVATENIVERDSPFAFAAVWTLA